MVENNSNHLWLKNYPENINWKTRIETKPLHDIIDSTANKFPENICTDFFGRTYSYHEIAKLSDKFAKGLQSSGVKKGDMVGIMLPNCPNYLIAYYGILKAGATVVNYNPLYTLKELIFQVNNSNTTILVSCNLNPIYQNSKNLLNDSCLEKVIIDKFETQLPTLKSILFRIFKSGKISNIDQNDKNILLSDIINNDGEYNKSDIDIENDIAVIQYTGGTTGKPKGAMLTHANLYCNTVQSGMWFEGLKEGGETMMAILPFFHVFSMTAVMNLSIYKGCKIVIHPRLNIKQLLKSISKTKATLLPGVPTLFTAINNFDNIDNYDLSSLKFCISGGAPLPLEVAKKFENIAKCRLIEGYGLTECSPVATVNSLYGENKTGSIGFPLPNVIVQIKDIQDHKKTMPTGEIGEVCIKGPNVMKGYLNVDSDENPIIDDFLHTGDLGYIDEDGYIFIVDRLKEMIITNGFNVYPREIEEELYKHPKIEEACIKGVNDKYSGQKIKAFIKISKNENLSKDEVIDFLKDKVTKYKLPSEVEFIDEMPKTMIGKISKKDL